MPAKYKHRRIGGVLFGTTDTAPANSTRYYTRHVQVTELTAVLIVPYNATLQHMRCYARLAAGAGETYTYLVRVGPLVTGIMANTALTCQTAGAAALRSDDLVNQVAVDEGDLICIRVITSLNATASRHMTSLQLIPR